MAKTTQHPLPCEYKAAAEAALLRDMGEPYIPTRVLGLLREAWRELEREHDAREEGK